MSSILVVEQELGTVQRIREVLSAEGMRVRIASGPGEALEVAAAEPPDLVLVSSDLPGASALAGAFSRRVGGPGLVAMVTPDPVARMFGSEADDQIVKPVTDGDLRLVVQRALAARSAPPPKVTRTSDVKLTSQDIFGDVLAEVESALPTAPLRPPRPAAPPVAPRATAPPAAGDEEIKRKLERTLSGVLGPEFLSRPAPTAARKPELPSDEVDALISKTLSNLDRSARPKTGQVPGQAPQAAPSPASPPRPAAEEATGVRKASPTKTDLDLSQLEDLARPRRRPDLPPAPGAPQPPTPAAAPLPAAVSSPPPPAAAAPPPARPSAPAPEPPSAVRPLPPPPADLPPLAPPTAKPASPAPTAPLATQRIDMNALFGDDESEGGERFGQYRLLEKIAVGGMAEVWKARMRGLQGFQKTVAIKKILPHMTDNADFIEMFIDEAKLAAQLSHPNIVHIYDLGQIGRDFYIAMEYVEGKDMRSLLNMAARNGHPMPLALALLIAARLASALHYAHRKRDFEGRELGLVHRDVSPQNVLLTLDGDVKLCDFGVAKAVSKASQTQVGALKGKLQYMSPEQAWGRPVDFRSDIFSLGVILFELLTGQRLFPGDSEMSILEAVRQNRIRSPRDVNPALPPQVDAIVARALATQAEERYASAGEMEHQIEAVLHELHLTPGSAELAAYIHQVLSGRPAEIERPPAAPAPAPSAAPPPPTPATSPGLFEPPAARPPAPSPAPPPPLAVTAPPPAAPARDTVTPIAAVGAPPLEEKKRGRGLLIAAILILLAVLAAVYFAVIRPRQTAPAAGGAPPPAAAPAAAAAPPPPAAPAASTPGGEKAGLPADVQGLVDREMAKKEEEIRRQFEEKKRKLEAEIARTKGKGKPGGS